MKRTKMFAVFPTLLTLGNAACGFGAITFAAKVGPDPAGEHDLFLSAMLIFLAMLFDMLDGSVARWAKQTSEFGAQLDSLCDAVSFGVAPAFLMLRIVHSMESTGGGDASALPLEAGAHIHPFFSYWSRLLWVIAALFALCALLRLARFNVETDEDDSHNYFSGLPSPAAAATVASFPIALRELRGREAVGQQIAEWLIPLCHLLLPIVTLAVAILMVSRFKYAHVFNQVRGQRSRLHLIQIIFVLATFFLVREAMPVIFCSFAFAPPARSAWREITRRVTRRPQEPRLPLHESQ